MTEFNSPSYRVDMLPVDALVWNADVVDNLNALNERLDTHYPYRIVQNTIVQTELFAKTLPASSLGANGFLIADLAAVIRNASGSTRYPYVYFTLGGASISVGTPSIATSANRIVYRVTFKIQNCNGEAVQLVMLDQAVGSPPAPAGSPQNMTYQGKWSTASVDTTAAQSLSVSVALDAAHPTYIFEMLCATVIGPIYKA